MKYQTFLVFLNVIFSVLVFCFHTKILSAETLVIDRVYLLVNSQMLTQSEAQDVALSLQTQPQSAGKKQHELEEQLLMRLVQEMLLSDRAQALKIAPAEKEIEARLEQLSEKQPQLLEVYTGEDLQEQLVRDFKKQRVLGQEVDSKIRIETPEIKLYCEQQRRKNRKIGLAQILLRGSAEEVQEQAVKIRQAFESGIAFAELAKLYSADPSAKRTGGELGVFKPGDLLAEIGEVATNLASGEMSESVQTSLGSHLLYIYKEEFAEGLDCANLSADQKTQYSNALFNQKREVLLTAYLDELYACANIEVKSPGNSGLPNATVLPKVETENINCQARRVMVIPQKKKKDRKNK